jgi:hypothetical protein
MLQIRWPSLPDFSSWASSASGIKLPKVKAHEIENQPEKRARTLKHLLKANHINHSIIYNDLRFHNHLPHILGSSYILGADSDELNHISEAESKHLEPWADSPGEIARHDWKDFLGKREYASIMIVLRPTRTLTRLQVPASFRRFLRRSARKVRLRLARAAWRILAARQGATCQQPDLGTWPPSDPPGVRI